VADVAGAHQAVDHLLATAVGVALERRLVSYEDPSPRSGRKVAAELVEDRQMCSAGRAADRARGGTQVRWGGDRGPRHLGGPVKVEEDVSELVHEARREIALEG